MAKGSFRNPWKFISQGMNGFLQNTNWVVGTGKMCGVEISPLSFLFLDCLGFQLFLMPILLPFFAIKIQSSVQFLCLNSEFSWIPTEVSGLVSR